MSNYVIPIIILIIIIYGIKEKRNIYEDFLNGAKEGLLLIYNIIPPILAITFAVNIFVKSNFLNDTLLFLKPIINIPLEVIPMALLRPISGTATLAILQSIFSLYGPDSFIGYLASTFQGCTDTTIYVLALYFGSIKITKTRYALIVGLFADLIGIISAIVVISIVYT
ncbi:MAG: spore maturation protein [Firmicutes bacterium]|nr:spore maturation protein [Bacillota bacterium]